MWLLIYARIQVYLYKQKTNAVLKVLDLEAMPDLVRSLRQL